MGNRKYLYFSKDTVLFRLSWGAIAFCLSLSGCRMDVEQVSRQRDAAVYAVLEQKWDDSFGSRSDYQIKPFSTELREKIYPEAEDSEILTLPEAARLAVSNSHEYQIARDQLYLTALDFTEIRHLYDWIPFSNTTGGYVREGDREALGVQTSSGVQRLMASGAVISSSFTAGYLDALTGDFRSGMSTIFQAAVTQPLLRGADRQAVLEALTQADRNTLYQLRTFNRFRQIFLVSVVSDYYRLLQLADQYDNAQTNYLQYILLINKMEKLASVGHLPRYELEEARQEKHQARDEYTQAQREYEEQLDRFKLKLEIPPARKIRLDQNEWQALMDASSKEINWSEEEALQAALNQRLDLANAYDQTVDAQRHVEVAADGLKTDLDLVGQYSPANDNVNNPRYIFGADPGDLQRTRDRYDVTLRMDLPLDRLAEKNVVKRTLIELVERQRNHLEITDQVTFEVRKACRDMEETRSRWRNQRQAQELARKRMDNTFALLQYGRANTRDVLDAQEDFYRTREEFALALTEYSIAVLNLYRDSGCFWVKPEGEWAITTAASGNKSIQMDNQENK